MSKKLTITHGGIRYDVKLRASSGHYMMHSFNNKCGLLGADIYECVGIENIILLKLTKSDGGQLRGAGVSELISKKAYLDIIDENRGPNTIHFHKAIMGCFTDVD